MKLVWSIHVYNNLCIFINVYIYIYVKKRTFYTLYMPAGCGCSIGLPRDFGRVLHSKLLPKMDHTIVQM